jgi:predicted PilT family ATPase
MPFGQLVVGPPGAGKSTFCNGMHHYLTLSGACAPRVAALRAEERRRALLAAPGGVR